MKPKYLILFLCFIFMLTGCTPISSLEEEAPIENTVHVTVGHNLEIENTNEQLILTDNKDTLAAEGLYYATWVMGDSQAFENSDGDTIDLYDAQLYLLLGESKSSGAARKNMDSWLSVGKTNYEIVNEEEISCSGQSYTLITYNCKNEDNPYARGVSAFGVFGNNAVCIELTCLKDFEGDLQAILTEFLSNCTCKD